MGAGSMMKISASLYAADPLRLAEQIDAVADHVDSLHIDIMDAAFTPEFGLHERLVRDVATYTTLPLDVHLMLRHPAKAAVRFAEIGARSIAFHVEGDHSVSEISNAIRHHGALAYVGIRHTTHVSELEQFRDYADGFLFLTAPAGGGAFDETAFDRLEARPMGFPTTVDGKVGLEHLKRMQSLGVDTVVLGAALFESGDASTRAAEISGLVREQRQFRLSTQPEL
ncbi:ribulose-phosphate 3-epimerase [Rhizobium nepotum]|uniref:ribulose-phosphate 3-epimerase n=1 Tax=Rhizobium nepotum TaxID=1035271 RepID=UPI00336A0F16